MWSWGKLQELFRTYICKQSNLLMKVQSYLFVFDSATFWHFLGSSGVLFGPLELFLVRDQLQNIFLEPTNVHYQFCFGSVSFCFWFGKIGGFSHFFCPLGLFLGLRSGLKTFLGSIYVGNQLWLLEYTLFLFGHICTVFGRFGLFFALWGYF